MPKIDDLLGSAERYRRAYILLEGPIVDGRPQMDQEVMEPRLMLEAFSSELYLKAMAAIRTGAFNKGHDLRKLFAKLSSQDQVLVKHDWDTTPYNVQLRALSSSVTGNKIPTFEEYLDCNAKLFEEIRYYHEGFTPPRSMLSPAMIGESVRRIIYRMFPNEYQHVRLPLPTGVRPSHESTPMLLGSRETGWPDKEEKT